MLIVVGLALLGWAASLLWLSPKLHEPPQVPQDWLRLEVALYVAAGVVYLLALAVLRPLAGRRWALWWVLGVGLGLRLLMCGTAPILQDDYHRYFWDGAVVASGHNPYEHSPAEAQTGDVPVELQTLATEHPETLRRINYPELTTIYPPVSQWVFTVSHWIEPASITAWRSILLLFELLTVGLLLVLCRRLGRSFGWVAIYWWCPIVVHEFFNGLHMDAVALPFVLGALLLLLARRAASAMVSLGFAVGAKLWPLALVPLMLRQVWPDRKRLARATAALAAVTLPMGLWMASGGLDRNSGLVAYARSWQNNGGLYELLTWVGGWAATHMGPAAFPTDGAVRALLGLLGVLLAAFLCLRPAREGGDLMRRCSLVIAAVLLLSPSLFPWYLTWFVPLAALAPLWSVLCYAALLPLYALPYDGPLVLWAQHAPVWALLGVEIGLRWRHAQRPPQQISPRPAVRP